MNAHVNGEGLSRVACLRLNNYGLISSKSMLIYHLKLKSAVSRKRLLGSQK